MARRYENHAGSPENLVVGLARTGDREAFAELVRRRRVQIWNLMRRCSGDVNLAKDLSQQVFLQAWRSLPQLRHTGRFGPWLKRIAISTWLQYERRNDPVRNAAELPELRSAEAESGIAVDLDRALAMLKPDVRICIVLAYHEGMTHDEIAVQTGFPTGTVKSHIRRGTQRLRERLAAYETASTESIDED